MSKHNFLTEKRLLRIKDIIGDKQKGIEPIIPICRSSFYNLIREGKLPAPKKIGKVSVWRAEDIKRFIEEGGV
ncbi:MAG: helix-turn-helix transcriptional regulator [Methylohalobius sp. ZOD2]